MFKGGQSLEDLMHMDVFQMVVQIHNTEPISCYGPILYRGIQAVFSYKSIASKGEYSATQRLHNVFQYTWQLP